LEHPYFIFVFQFEMTAETNARSQPLLVMKFGGTSVGNAERMLNVADTVKQ
jgi:aspartokinase